MNAGNLLTHPLDQGIGFLFRDMAAHLLQHMIADVLQSDVQVLANILPFTHHTQQVEGETGRIGIMQTDPLHARNVGNPLHQFRQGETAIKVPTIEGQVLGDHLKLLHPLINQQAHLTLDLLHRTSLIMAVRRERL